MDTDEDVDFPADAAVILSKDSSQVTSAEVKDAKQKEYGFIPRSFSDQLTSAKDAVSGDYDEDSNEELQHLKDDNYYHEFIQGISDNKNPVSEDVDSSFEYHDDPDLTRDTDGSSSEDEDPDEVEAQVGVPLCHLPQNVQLEYVQRFPIFWRTRRRFFEHDRTVERGEYNSDEDLAYEPSPEELEEKDSDSSHSDEENLQSEEENVDDLVKDMMELDIQPTAVVEGEMEPTEGLAQAIMSFEDKGYDEKNDPDYKPEMTHQNSNSDTQEEVQEEEATNA